MKTDHEVLKDRDDALMMERTHLWPRIWVLPVKKYWDEGEWPKLGFLLKGEGPTIFLGNAEEADPLTVIERYDEGEWPVEQFTTYNEAAAAGWLVD